MYVGKGFCGVEGILALPERYCCLQARVSMVYEWKGF